MVRQTVMRNAILVTLFQMRVTRQPVNENHVRHQMIVAGDLFVFDDSVMQDIVEMALFHRGKNVKQIMIVHDMVMATHVTFVDVCLLDDEDEEIQCVAILLQNQENNVMTVMEHSQGKEGLLLRWINVTVLRVPKSMSVVMV